MRLSSTCSLKATRHCKSSHTLIVLFLLSTSSTPVQALWTDKFAVCKQNVLGVLNGTHSMTTASMANITNITIWDTGYIYNGSVRELKPSFNRSDYLTLTYEGK